MPGFSVILLPTDRNAPASEAMVVARSLADRDARLIILRIAVDAGDVPAGGIGRPAPVADRIEIVTRCGAPAEAIIGLAEEVGCELIVLGARGPARGPGEDLGLVAQEVLRRAACPVLCLPAATPEPGATSEPQTHAPAGPLSPC